MRLNNYKLVWLALSAAFLFINLGNASAQTADYGDAPHSYDSLAAAASHKVIPTLYIGANNVDSESAPFASINADGDNLNGNNDENGVSTLPTIYTLSPTVGVQVNGVYNSSGVPAVLVGWIDFNRDGIFEDSERSQILPIDTAAAAANQFLLWDGLTPAMMNAGPTYMRIRLTTDTTSSWFTNPSPNGARNSGEVEDYAATIIPLGSQTAFLLDSLNTYENAANHGSSSIYKFFKKAGVSNIVGGERDTKQTVTGAGLSALTVGGGIMYIGNYFQTNSSTVVTYDGPDHDPDALNPTGLNGVDLSAGSYFAVDYGKDLTTAGDTLIMKIYSDATHWSQLKFPLPATNNNPVRFFFPFTNFSTGPGATGPMNIQSVGAIQFVWNLYQGSDVTVSYIGIPEPKRDYGDAPASYDASVLGAASHLRDDNVKIGALIDTNSAPVSSIHCDGDNLDALNDEDAITDIPIISTISSDIKIVVHNNTNFSDTTAALVGWIDFNHDGVFSQTERSLVTLVPRNITGTTNDTLHWTGLTPAQIVSATTPLRVRFTTDNTVVGATNWFTDPQPVGYRADGEVEDYLAPIYHVDGGDVSGYPWARAYINPDENNDGKPDSVSSVWLGEIVDGEVTNLANAAATGDDITDMADEDGVRNSGTPVISMPITFFVDANHQGSKNDSAVIGLWIDWNGNGSFNDASDFFATEKVYFTGAGKVTKSYTMTVPGGASVTSYVVRAGIYPLPNTSSITYTKNYTFPDIQISGEWEDYKNNIKLPINLLSFDAQAAGNTSLLNWSLVKGSDLASTTIMRSKDGKDFIEIGTAEATKGNTNYTFTDESPLDGDNFYRITLNDLSGDKKLSTIKKVSFGKRANAAIAEGTKGGMKLRLLNATQDANYEILSGKGQIVAKGAITGTSIKDVSGLVPGLYVVSFKDAQGNHIQNITVTVF